MTDEPMAATETSDMANGLDETTLQDDVVLDAVRSLVDAAEVHRGVTGPGHLGCGLCRAVDHLREVV